MILLTGGLGYIGSHLAAALMAGGHEVILVDNLSNARMEMLERLEFMAGRYVTFFRLDIRNTPALQKIFEQYAITAVVHCAGMKATTDSAMQPLDYYNANVGGTMSLLRVMQRTGVRNLVYGSSATVYGNPTQLPVSESAALNPLTPYANSNRMCEDILRDLVTAEGDWRIAILRYFSVAGAHPSAVIGEWPSGIASNLMPYLAQVAREQRTHLEIFGNDYDTPDGTGVRDYIHVMDVVDGHMQALHWLFNQPQQAFDIFNLGRGEGVSVKQMLDAFEAVLGRRLPHEVVQRRQGDAAAVYADVSRARELLGFEAKRNVHDMAKDMWTFYQTLT
jgi:UDP-glucose 4-epimerase